MKILKEKSIRVTPQRAEVLKVLYNEGGHLTAEQIYERIKAKLPAVSRATVYTVLELFKKNSIVREICIRPGKASFDSRIDNHHHFFCRQCGEIFDIDMRLCPAVRKEEINGHKIEELHGYFYGLCNNCWRRG